MRRRAAGALACLALLAACSGEPEVREPDPTSSPTPTITSPPDPDQASEASDEGAAAFVEHWIDVFNYSAITGNAEPLRALGPDCTSCLTYAETIEKEFRSGGAPTRPIWKSRDFIVKKDGDSYEVTARIDARDKTGPVVYELGFMVSERAPRVVTELFLYED